MIFSAFFPHLLLGRADLAAGAAFLLLASVAGAARAGEWERLPDLPEGNGGMVVVGHRDGLRVAGGTNWRGEEKVWLDQIWEWTPGSAWRVTGRLPRGTGYGAGASLDGTLLLFGGQDGAGRVPDFLEINTAGEARRAGEWREGGESTWAVPLAGDRRWYVLTRSAEGARCFELEGRSRTFRPWPTLPNAAWGGPAVVAAGDGVLILGGAVKGEGAMPWRNQEAILRFDPARASYARIGQLPVKGRGLAAVALDSTWVYCAGGYVDGADGQGIFSTRGFLVSAATGEVRESRALPLGVMGHLVIVGKHLYLLGGEDRMRHRSAAVHRLALADLPRP